MCAGLCFASCRTVSLPRPVLPAVPDQYIMLFAIIRGCDSPPVTKKILPERSGMSSSGVKVLRPNIMVRKYALMGVGRS